MAVHQETDPGSSGPVPKIWFWCFMFFMLLKMKMPISLLQSDMAMEKWWNMWVDNLVTCHCSLNDYLEPKMFLYMMSIQQEFAGTKSVLEIIVGSIQVLAVALFERHDMLLSIRLSGYVIVSACFARKNIKINMYYIYLYVLLHMGTHDDQPCDAMFGYPMIGQIHIRSYMYVCVYVCVYMYVLYIYIIYIYTIIYTHICCGLSGTFKKNAFGEPKPL